MRTTLNKALIPQNNKEKNIHAFEKYSGKKDGMNKELKRVSDAVATIEKAHPESRRQFLSGIAAAQEAAAAAVQAKENAETEGDYDKACEDEKKAHDKEAFFKKQLDRIDFSMRMEEETYYGHVDAVKATVEKAAADFRKVAEKAMEDILNAKAAYMAIITGADEVLSALDAAANVLQVKYRYKTKNIICDGPKPVVEDRNEWKRHAIRYTGRSAKGIDLVLMDGNNWNEITAAAWYAAGRVEKKGY